MEPEYTCFRFVFGIVSNLGCNTDYADSYLQSFRIQLLYDTKVK